MKTYKIIAAVCDYCVYPLLFVVGAPTNVVNLLVFWRQGLYDRINLCLFALALTDLGYVLVVSTLAVLKIFEFFDPDRGSEYYTKSLACLLGLMYTLKTISGCVTMVIAVERCICVVYPLQASSVISTRAMATLLGALAVSSSLLHVPVSLKYSAAGVYSQETGRIQWRLIPSPMFAQNKAAFEAIHDLLLSSAVPLLTFLVVWFATAKTVTQLRFSAEWRKAAANLSTGSDAASQLQLAATRMLVLICCVYIVCSFPILALSLTRAIIPGFTSGGRYYNVFLAAHLYAMALTVVNSSVSFFVYFSRSSRYRKTLSAICGRSQRTTNALRLRLQSIIFNRGSTRTKFFQHS